MRNSLSPEKPTTSASTALPLGNSTEQPLPTASFRPVASITNPATRVRRPLTRTGLVWATSSLQSRRKLCRRSLRRASANSLDPGMLDSDRADHALPAAFEGGVDFAFGGLDAAAAAADLGVL